MMTAPRRGGWRRAGPLFLCLFGGLLLVPMDGVRHWIHRGSDLLLTVRVLDPRQFTQPEVALAAEAAGPSPWVVKRLEDTRRALHPPGGWSADGLFHSVAVGNARSPDRLELALFGEVPPDQPVLLGDQRVAGARATVLIGYTRQREGRRPEVIPITSKSFRAAAFAGDPTDPEPMSFVAQGEGTERLSVQAPRSLHGLEDGALVWVNPAFAEVLPGEWQPPPRDRLILGTIWRDPEELEADRAYHVIPAWQPAALREVVVLYPAGFPGPQELAWRGRRVKVTRRNAQDRGRLSWTLAGGRERDFQVGAAVASGEHCVGLLTQVGYGVATLRDVRDPGFQARVFLVDDERCEPWVMEVVEADKGAVRLKGPAPSDDLDGATVATTFASELVPPGLVFGTLSRRDDSWWLVTPHDVLPAVSVFVPNSSQEPTP